MEIGIESRLKLFSRRDVMLRGESGETSYRETLQSRRRTGSFILVSP